MGNPFRAYLWWGKVLYLKDSESYCPCLLVPPPNSVSTFAAKDGNGNNVQLCLANDLEPQPAVIDGNNAVRVTLWDCDHNPRIVWNFIPTNATLML